MLNAGLQVLRLCKLHVAAGSLLVGSVSSQTMLLFRLVDKLSAAPAPSSINVN